MSTHKTLVLTRPAERAAILLARVEAALGCKVPVIHSPILAIVPSREWPDLSEAEIVIVTSAHAIHGPLTDKKVVCVGERTADAVRAAGGLLRHCAPNAAALLDWMKSQPDPGRVIYLRGSHVATDIPAALDRMSVAARSVQTYRQNALPLTDAARAVLEGDAPAVLPLFSPRSARLVGQAIAKCGPNLHVIAISDAVAKEWNAQTRGSAEVARYPGGDAMLDRIVAALRH